MPMVAFTYTYWGVCLLQLVPSLPPLVVMLRVYLPLDYTYI